MINSLWQKYFHNNEHIGRFAPFLILVAIEIVSIGINIPKLGYYYDDWYLLWSGSARGASSIIPLFSTDRPYMGVLYSFTYSLFQDNLIAWHLFAFVLRLLGGFGFYGILRVLFPKQSGLIFFMVAIFFVYPGFLSQPNANTKQNHLLSYSFAIYSIYFSLIALKVEQVWKKLIWSSLSALFAINYFFIYEYMIGLEFARIIFLSIVVYRERLIDWRHRALDALKIWSPITIALGIFLYWRFFIFVSTRSATSVGKLASSYLDNLQLMTYRLVFQTLKDLFDTTIFAWFAKPYLLFQSADNTDLFVGLLLACALTILIIRFMDGQHDPESEPDARLLIVTGIGITLAAIFPVVLSYREFDPSDAYKSYGLHPTMGLAMLVGGVYLQIRKNYGRVLVVSLLVIAITTQYLNGIAWGNFWELEKQTWRQLTYRAPDILDDTLVVAWLPDGTQFQQDYEIWAPINLIYRTGERIRPMIQGEVFHSKMFENLYQAVETERFVRDIFLKQNYGQFLLLSVPSEDSCLHVYNGKFLVLAKSEPYQLRDIAGFSDTGRINTSIVDSPNLPVNIFGSPTPRDWCYYYQRAELAIQQGDWQTAADIYDQVIELELNPQDEFEWFPFIQGLMNVERYSEANKQYSKNLADEHYYQIQICDRLRSNPNYRAGEGYRADLLHQMVCEN